MNRGIGYNELIEELIERQYQEERLDIAPQTWEELVPEDAIMQTHVEQKDSLYIVYINMVNLEDPTCFVRTPARVCHNQRTAEIIASYKCRLCSCEQCIPLKVDIEDFDFSDN